MPTWTLLLLVVMALLALKLRQNLKAVTLDNALALQKKGRAAEAEAMLKTLSDEGSLPASMVLANLYLEGNRPREGIEILTKVAATGYLNANLILAKIYSEGTIVPRDMKQVKSWLVPVLESRNPEVADIAGQFSAES